MTSVRRLGGKLNVKKSDGTLTPKDLNKKIKSGDLNGVFLFYGEEQFRLNGAVEVIAKKLIPKGTESFNYFKFTGKDTSAAEILAAAEQYPQMSDMKLIVVSDSGLLNNATLTDFKLLRDARISDDTCLIFTEKDFDKKKLKNIKFISESGGVVVFDFMPVNELMIWVEKRFKNAEKGIADKEINYMLSHCGRSLAAVDHACEKLINYSGDRNKISRDDIDAVVEKTVEYRVYDMINSIVSDAPYTAYEQLKFLQKQPKTDPFYILGLMMTQLSELLCCKLLKEDGLSPAEIGSYFDYNRPSFVVNNTVSASRRYSEGYLKRMLDKGLYYDTECKQGRLSPWAAVEMYLGELMLIRRTD